MTALRTAVLLTGFLAGTAASAAPVEISVADYNLSRRLLGGNNVDTAFGAGHGFRSPAVGAFNVGTVGRARNTEMVTVFGFRLTDDFRAAWKERGSATLVFSIIEFHEGDPYSICPLHVDLLGGGFKDALEAAHSGTAARIGSIGRDRLELDRVHQFTVPYPAGSEAGEVLWIGINGGNPMDDKKNNVLISGDLVSFPGTLAPLLLTGGESGRSGAADPALLAALNLRFSAPRTGSEAEAGTGAPARFVNPLRTRSRRDTLEALQLLVGQERSRLPGRPPFEPSGAIGLHSSFKPPGESWRFTIPVFGDRTTSVVLFPAVRRAGAVLESYGFPKRFLITAYPRNPDAAPVVVADWRDRDFPHDAFTPVIFPFPWASYDRIEMTVYKGREAGDRHFFALGEIRPLSGFLTRRATIRIDPRDTWEAPPFWSSSYATDGRTHFGMDPASGYGGGGGFHGAVAPGEASRGTLIVDFATEQPLDSIELHPTAHPLDARLPPPGFPRGIRLGFSNSADGSDPVFSTRIPRVDLRDGRSPLVVDLPGVSARFARVTLEGADPVSGGTFRIEEVTVNGGIPVPDAIVATEQFAAPGEPERLNDGIVNGNRWNQPLLRTVELIRRHTLDRELDRLRERARLLDEAHERTVRLLTVAGFGSLALLAVAVTVRLRLHARRETLRVRRQIQQDLHDEIGSQLSSIALATDLIKRRSRQEANRLQLQDVNQCAREAIASLDEVIWLTDKDVLTLDRCLQLMEKRARSMVSTQQLEVDFPARVPAAPLTGPYKRNLFLLFTEALNNSMKHSGARTIRVRAQIDGQRLTLGIMDDGTGFETGKVTKGIGLRSMANRAEAMSGSLSVESAPGTGTQVTFTGPYN